MLMLFITCLPSEVAVCRVLPAEYFAPEFPSPPQPVFWVIPNGLKGWHLSIFWDQKRANSQAWPQQRWEWQQPPSPLWCCAATALSPWQVHSVFVIGMGWKSGKAEQKRPQTKPNLVLWHSSHPLWGQSENPKRQRWACCTERWCGLVQVVETAQPWENLQVFNWKHLLTGRFNVAPSAILRTMLLYTSADPVLFSPG